VTGKRNERENDCSLGEVVFRPDHQAVAGSQLSAFRRWCEARTGQHLPDHAAMDRFSVKEFRNFWRLFLEWCDLPREGAVEPVCVGDACDTARFFPDLRLNYAECLLAGSPDQPVLMACNAGGSRDGFTRGALRVAVAQLATSLQRIGVRAVATMSRLSHATMPKRSLPRSPPLPLARPSPAARRTWACPPSSRASPLSSP
jgi:acetoacetyl-CoA synthetase